MYVYVCICMYMYVYVCICMYMYVHVCTCMYMYVCICMYITCMSADCTITLLHFGVVEHSAELLMGDY
jgi:hypothetical protein